MYYIVYIYSILYYEMIHYTITPEAAATTVTFLEELSTGVAVRS